MTDALACGIIFGDCVISTWISINLKKIITAPRGQGMPYPRRTGNAKVNCTSRVLIAFCWWGHTPITMVSYYPYLCVPPIQAMLMHHEERPVPPRRKTAVPSGRAVWRRAMRLFDSGGARRWAGFFLTDDLSSGWSNPNPEVRRERVFQMVFPSWKIVFRKQDTGIVALMFCSASSRNAQPFRGAMVTLARTCHTDIPVRMIPDETYENLLDCRFRRYEENRYFFKCIESSII